MILDSKRIDLLGSVSRDVIGYVTILITVG